MCTMNSLFKYVILYSLTLGVIPTIALPTFDKVIEPAINYETIPEEKIHPGSDEDFNNEEAEVNRSKKSTTLCLEIKSGTPECVPCQPVIMETQPQVVYMTNNNTSSDSTLMNNTLHEITHRNGELILPPEPPCMKDEIFLILPPQQVQPTVSMVQVPIVHQVPQTPQILVATKPFLETHFPELLNNSNVQIQPLLPADDSLPIFDPQFPQLFQQNSNPFAVNKNDNWNMNLDSKENIYQPAVLPSGPELKLSEPSENQGIGANLELGVEMRNQEAYLRPPEHQGMGQAFGNGAVSSQYASPVGLLENHGAGVNMEVGVGIGSQAAFLQPPQHHSMGENLEYGAVPQSYHPFFGMGQNFGFNANLQHQPSYIYNQQGSAYNKRVIPPQQYSSLFMNNHASGQHFVNGGVDQVPVQEPVKSQRPVNDFQMQQDYFSHKNIVMGQDGLSYYVVPAIINGSPQLCLQPGPITNPSLVNVHQQSSTQHQNVSASATQQSSSANKQSRETKILQETLKSPEVQTTVAPVKSSLKSQQDGKGKGGSNLLNHLKGSSSLSKAKALGKGQNKDNRTNEKSKLKGGNKKETEILVDK